MYIYIVQEVEILEDKNVQGVIKGAFTTRRAAGLSVKYHKKNLPEEKVDNILYDIVKIQINCIGFYSC